MQRTLLIGYARLAVTALALTAAQHADAAVKHRYSFTTDANDSVSGAHGAVVDAGVPTATFAGGVLNLTANTGELSNAAIANDAYVNLPNGIISAMGTKASFETWVTVETNRNWAEIFSFGSSRPDSGGENLSSGWGRYITLIPDTGDGADTFRVEAIQFPDGGAPWPFGAANVSRANGAVLPTGVEHHIVSIFDTTDTMGGANPNGTVKNYLNGALIGATPLYAGFSLTAIPDVNNWLGRSQWGDPLFDGSFNEFRIHDTALNDGEVAFNSLIGPDQVAAVPAAGIFSLEVNTVTNAVKLKSNVGVSVPINYYEITSAAGTLSTSGWNSLDDQEGGDPPGQGWDESGGVNAGLLSELALPVAGVMVGPNAQLSLGNAFNKSVLGNGVNGDLIFKFGLANGALLSGTVSYVTNPAVDDADFDGDGDVDGGDFLTWQRGLGLSGAAATNAAGNANGDTVINGADLAIWKTQFGPAAVAAVGSVPEPTAAGMSALALLGLSIVTRHRGSREAR
jgi:hypothetical protein